MINLPDYDRIAALLEQEARLKLELAQAFRTRASEAPVDRDAIRPLNLGSLQQAIFDVLLTADGTGFSPREIAKKLDRGDEPNVRSALDRMRDRGITELVAGCGTQRWQLTVSYRRT
jgi:hypothetical protein